MALPVSVPLDDVRAVLFDLDGTLVDTEGDIARALSETLARFGVVVGEDLLRTLAGQNMRDWFRATLGMNAAQAEAVYSGYVEHSVTNYAPNAKPVAFADALLTALASAGTPLALVTTRVARSTDIVLRATGWTDRFRVVVTQTTTPRQKPAPDPALHALAALAVRPRLAAFVGNTEADMGCGAAAGLGAVIGVLGDRTAEALFDAGATHVCSDLEQVLALLAPALTRAAQG